MKSLLEIIKEAESRNIAIGHFNISDIVGLKAIFEVARELKAPVIIGTSEGEREFIGLRQAAALIKSLRDEYDYPTPNKSLRDYTGQVFLNADHTHSLEKVKEAAEARYDAILFDGGKLPLEENIRQTKEVVDYVKTRNSRNPDLPAILVEGEIGYIGSSSEIQKELPAGAALKPEDLTTPEQAREFVEKTGVDLLAPAVGNIHGIIVKEGFVEKLDIERIKAIKSAVNVPLVLHGGSGLSDDDFRQAIKAGISIVHINTELRAAWRRGLEAGLKENPDEIAPYKIYPQAVEKMKKVVREKLELFNQL